MSSIKVVISITSLVLAPPVLSQGLARPSGTEKTQQATMNDVPHCVRKLGTISVVDGDDPRGWTQYSLAPPQKLLKVLIQRSGCFNLVDRGSGLQAAQLERNVGADLGLQRRSNVGQGQIKAADYVLVAEIQGANGNASGSAVAGGIGGLVGGRVGGLLGGLRNKKMEANTVVSVTNVRTTETIAVEDGYAAKNSLSFGGGGGVGFFGGAAGLVGGGYDNTDIGRIVTLSFIQAYSKLVNSLGLLQPGSSGTAEAAPSKTFTAQAPVAMRASAVAAAKVIRTLPIGAIVYPTGNKNGPWWEVADENDNIGWVLNTKLAPSSQP
ncbi:Curli biogenesis system outer membrane secretion channel CsgG [Sphingomonas gellani]|uniref:Curli biogenesis system outer membrane secretion channel CsgG n=2 Tax=Sphingomonas gellani TaxID=1166340 RepID=A0A1H8HCS6_9SPHN|nr:CsgG/HfaB family protein [Sphingomonas gellani]SEN53890.1 Curli biogenesis system outer membrane secretion channel CsgG [Sphingomonas gellani]